MSVTTREIERVKNEIRHLETELALREGRTPRCGLDDYIFGTDYIVERRVPVLRASEKRAIDRAARRIAPLKSRFGKKTKEQRAGMAGLKRWEKEQSMETHGEMRRRQFHGDFVRAAVASRRARESARARARLSNAEVLAVGGEPSDDHFEGCL